ncbi:MAG TPA: beta-ketoacyl-[acyl-carrier-protein] synthase family protein, partial [Thermomicrobiales bacterium]|nr:beta-ketoacyl-[acyl-carrier-protein] synthase family protein [Thermomicrobiales bacterium]
MSSSSRSGRRVVITGLGLISPLGNSPDSLWEALSAGRSAVAALTQFSPGSLPTPFGAEARQFSGGIDDFGPLAGDQKKQIRKALKVMCRECQMGVAAAQMALGDSRLSASQRDPERAGVVFGSDYMVSLPDELNAPVEACLDANRDFHFERWGPQGIGTMNPLWLLKYLPNMPASHVAIYNDLRGPNNSLTQREASANLAIGEAFRVIARNHAEVMLAGATGTRIHPMKAIHARINEQLANAEGAPEKAARPFDLHRSGMVLGEGAGAIVLEELEHARARGATIYGEIVAAASSAVVDRQLTARRDLALANAMRSTLGEAGCTPEQVGHLHAHGLSTRQSDIDEARAIREVFGRYADRVPVVAAKSDFGNLGAGSGVIEAI